MHRLRVGVDTARSATAMANPWEATTAVIMRADVQRESHGDFVEEIEESAEARAVDAWAEMFVRRGVERKMAMRCAGDVWESEQKKDRATLEQAQAPAMANDGLLEALSRVREARSSKLSLGCLFLAIGRLPYGITSMRDLAKEQNVSVEAVSNEVEEFQAILGLPRNSIQKSPAAVMAYAGCNGAKIKARKT